MTSTTISNVRETSIETMRDDAIVVTNTGAIKSATTSIYGGSGAFTILGSVTSDQGGIDVKGGHIGSYSRNSSVSVGASGSIVGGTFGARIGSNYDIIVSDVFNAGLIVGQKAEGLFLGGNVVNLINEGTIQSYLGTALIVEARGAVINNTGTIIGGGDLFENKAIQFLNEGSIIVNNSGDIYGDISGGAYDDTYDGRFGFIQGKIDLGLGNNTAIGGEGSEIFIVSGGSNAVDGGGGNDSVAFEGATTGVHVDLRITESQDTHFGMLSLRQVETVNGSSHNDTLIGNENSNALFGGNGNDTLEDTSGNDTLDGGGDIDTALFSGSAGAHVDLAISNRQNTGYGSDVIIGIENLKGGSGSDWFKGDANANLLSGNGGNDTLAGGLGDDTLDGGAGINTAVFAGQAAD
ncbi:calcium-binding protein, partial [Microvirga sp. 2YAF29]|uniref:calcium-binding protein n=1 Tax=Microvirga sp. 2YAF29 TaxID=3233031 RepID=UPI003F9B314A